MFVRTYILTILGSGFLFKQNYGTAVAKAPFFVVFRNYKKIKSMLNCRIAKESIAILM